MSAAVRQELKTYLLANHREELVRMPGNALILKLCETELGYVSLSRAEVELGRDESTILEAAARLGIEIKRQSRRDRGAKRIARADLDRIREEIEATSCVVDYRWKATTCREQGDSGERVDPRRTLVQRIDAFCDGRDVPNPEAASIWKDNVVVPFRFVGRRLGLTGDRTTRTFDDVLLARFSDCSGTEAAPRLTAGVYRRFEQALLALVANDTAKRSVKLVTLDAALYRLHRATNEKYSRHMASILDGAAGPLHRRSGKGLRRLALEDTRLRELAAEYRRARLGDFLSYEDASNFTGYSRALLRCLRQRRYIKSRTVRSPRGMEVVFARHDLEQFQKTYITASQILQEGLLRGVALSGIVKHLKKRGLSPAMHLRPRRNAFVLYLRADVQRVLCRCRSAA